MGYCGSSPPCLIRMGQTMVAASRSGSLRYDICHAFRCWCKRVLHGLVTRLQHRLTVSFAKIFIAVHPGDKHRDRHVLFCLLVMCTRTNNVGDRCLCLCRKKIAPGDRRHSKWYRGRHEAVAQCRHALPSSLGMEWRLLLP